jgi:hypothetical protein
MRRILLVMSIAALMAAMVVASAMPAFASPISPGPNSVEPIAPTGVNFGHCQSADVIASPRVQNPAIFLGPEEPTSNFVCPKLN